jgi:hypothetical protein
MTKAQYQRGEVECGVTAIFVPRSRENQIESVTDEIFRDAITLYVRGPFLAGLNPNTQGPANSLLYHSAHPREYAPDSPREGRESPKQKPVTPTTAST